MKMQKLLNWKMQKLPKLSGGVMKMQKLLNWKMQKLPKLRVGGGQ